MGTLRTLRWTVLTALAGAASGVCACGLHDASSVATLRGALQLAYPDALHVRTAVWQAQLAGALPRDALALSADLPPEARASLRLFKAHALLRNFAARLDATGATQRPAVAMVLVGPMLWSRFAGGDGPVRAQVHVAGPQAGDVVAVTDIAVLEAIANGTIGVGNALDAGLIRLYGAPEAAQSARRWLEASSS